MKRILFVVLILGLFIISPSEVFAEGEKESESQMISFDTAVERVINKISNDSNAEGYNLDNWSINTCGFGGVCAASDLRDATEKSLSKYGISWDDLRSFLGNNNLTWNAYTIIKPLMLNAPGKMRGHLRENMRRLRFFLSSDEDELYYGSEDLPREGKIWNSKIIREKDGSSGYYEWRYDDANYYYKFARRRYLQGGTNLITTYKKIIDDFLEPKNLFSLEK